MTDYLQQLSDAGITGTTAAIALNERVKALEYAIDTAHDVYNRLLADYMAQKATNAALEAKITAAGDLLEQISAWMWKNQGMPEPMWADQFAAVCKMFEPEYKHE